MAENSQFVLVAKRMLRELRALNQAVSAGFLGVQEKISSIRDQQEAQNQQWQEHEERPRILNAELQIPETVRHEKRTSDKYHLTIQAVTAGATVLAFLAAAIYAGIAARQLKQMKIATEKAGIGAEAAKSAADTAATQLELAERPWISSDIAIASPFVFDKDGGHVTFQFALKNSGHSPNCGSNCLP